jgi:hypothetical protein
MKLDFKAKSDFSDATDIKRSKIFEKAEPSIN